MNMECSEPAELAAAHFAESYSCSQSLLLAYAPRLGIEPGMAARIAAPFGGGIAHMGWTCGAVTGALMVIGLRCGHEAAGDRETRERTHAVAGEFISLFDARNGSVVCRELLGHNVSTPEEMASAMAEGAFESCCPNLVRDAAEIVGNVLDWD